MTWKGIKTLVSMKQKNDGTPSLITKDEKYINDLVSITNNFDNFFTAVAEIVHSKIKFSKNHSGISCHQKSMILS